MALIFRSDDKKFRKKVLDNVRRSYRSTYPKIRNSLKTFLTEQLKTEFYANKTVDSISNGILKGELGLTTPEANLEAILQKMISTINITVSAPADLKTIMSIRLEAVRDDFQDLLALGAATQDWTDRQNKEVRGEPLPWLEWLLLEGNNVIVADFRVTHKKGLGRSGELAIMEPVDGSFWRVPPSYQGTITDNFILDIVVKVKKEMNKRVWQIVRRVIAQLS